LQWKHFAVFNELGILYIADDQIMNFFIHTAL